MSIAAVPDDFERIPPHDLAAEQCTLGGMLLSKDAQADVAEVIRPSDHYRPAHQVIHEAILALQERGQPADAITVADYLQQAGQITKIGGASYLHTLIASVPTAANAGYYARIVKKHSALRGLISAGATVGQLGWAADADLDEMPQRVEAAYRALDEATGRDASPGSRSVADLIAPAIERIEKGPAATRGVATGWADLDELLLGLQPGEMVTVGARPAMGKSTVMLNVAAHAALRRGVPVLVASLEMSEQECTERILAAEAGVALHSIRAADLGDADWDRIAKAYERISACPHLLLNTDGYLSVQGIRSELRSMRRAGTPAGLVVIDYLQLMTSGAKPESRQAEVSEISRGIKLLAKEFDLPVLVGSQLNRGPEMRTDHRPMLSDLRESGSVEQDSSIVILLFREDSYEPESPRAGEIDFIVAKNRQGPQATLTLAFQGHYARCVDMYRPWTPASAIGSAA
jgi:replicative DNA helicase